MCLVQDLQTELYPELQHPGQPSPGVDKVQLPPVGLNDSASSVAITQPHHGAAWPPVGAYPLRTKKLSGSP